MQDEVVHAAGAQHGDRIGTDACRAHHFGRATLGLHGIVRTGGERQTDNGDGELTPERGTHGSLRDGYRVRRSREASAAVRELGRAFTRGDRRTPPDPDMASARDRRYAGMPSVE